MIWSNLEYVSMRLVRRFLLPGSLSASLGALLPSWRGPQTPLDPESTVTSYQRLARLALADLTGKRVLELGCGPSNGTGYEWTARFGGTWTGLEASAAFDQQLDSRIFELVRWRSPGVSRQNTHRVSDAAALADRSFELIVSNLALEHVRDPQALFSQCRRLLAPGGHMLHRVDYRDTFLKYPFQFLTFSTPIWENALNPGDLPRHRLDDHLAALARCGFQTQIWEHEKDFAGLAAVEPFLDPLFARKDREILATTTVSLTCTVPEAAQVIALGH